MDLNAILVATDFSDCACAAFLAAEKVGRPFGAKLIVLHVINQGMVNRLAEHLNQEPDNLIPALRERALRQMGEFLKHCNTTGLEVETMVAVGIPFQEISVIARDLAVDLVVMGGYGRGGRGHIEEVFFGSTAEKVVRLLPCPVLCVPLEGREEKGKGQ